MFWGLILRPFWNSLEQQLLDPSFTDTERSASMNVGDPYRVLCEEKGLMELAWLLPQDETSSWKLFSASLCWRCCAFVDSDSNLNRVVSAEMFFCLCSAARQERPPYSESQSSSDCSEAPGTAGRFPSTDAADCADEPLQITLRLYSLIGEGVSGRTTPDYNLWCVMTEHGNQIRFLWDYNPWELYVDVCQ